MKPKAAPREPKAERALRRDAPLAAHLRARGLCAHLVVSRLDGAPLSMEDIAEADAALVAFESADRRAWKAFAAANADAANEPRTPTDARALGRAPASGPASPRRRAGRRR